MPKHDFTNQTWSANKGAAFFMLEAQDLIGSTRSHKQQEFLLLQLWAPYHLEQHGIAMAPFQHKYSSGPAISFYIHKCCLHASADIEHILNARKLTKGKDNA